MFGKLRIEAWQDPGKVGSSERGILDYDWPWYNHLSSLALWAIVILLLVLIRENRSRPAWLIWLPVLIIYGIWGMARQILPFPSSTSETFSLLITLIILSLASVWLLGDWLGRYKGIGSFFMAIFLMAGIGILGISANFSFHWDRDATSISVIFGVGALNILLALTLASRCCRKKFTAIRFMLFLLLWLPICTIASILIYMGIFMIFKEAFRSTFPGILWQTFIIGTIFGLVLYLIPLPFMILAFRSGFYRRRLEGCLNLPAPAAESGNPVTAETENVEINDIT